LKRRNFGSKCAAHTKYEFYGDHNCYDSILNRSNT
jgi:hypothetical protein